MAGYELKGYELNLTGKILNCVPNVSEGRDRAVIDAIAGAVRSVRGVRLITVHSDADHNRSVFSFAGGPDAVLCAATALAKEAIARVDMSRHKGAHPRIGAVDVTPFIPVAGAGVDDALAVCRAYGRWVGEQGIPVYYYEDAAVSPARVNLADVRRGGYEGLLERLLLPEWTPDEGPALFNARSGAFAVGVRFPLVAFNVNLSTDDVSVARKVARAVRESSGGLKYVKALGLLVAGMAQVSMNLTNYTRTPVYAALEAVRSEAAKYGATVTGTELVGAVPAAAVADIARFYMKCSGLDETRILELNCDVTDAGRLPSSAAGDP